MAKKNYERLRTILKEKGTYDINVLAKKLGMNEYQTKEYLLQFLYSELSCLDTYAEHVRIKYLYKIFKYFERASNKKELENIKFNLEKCSKLCLKRLAKIPKEKLPEDCVFSKMLDNISVTYLGIDYLPTKEESDVGEVSYELLDYIINDLHNYNYLFELLKTFPQNLTVKNKKGEYLIESLLDKYLEIVMEDTQYSDIIFYEKVIKLFINNPKIYVDKEIQKKMLEKTKNTIKRIDESYDVFDKKKAYFFLNEVFTDISEEKEATNFIADMEKLNYKYQIKPEFTKKVLSDALKELELYDGQTIDCTDKHTITIDKESTWAYDDACSLEVLPNGNYLLGIYVTDVASHVKRGSQIDLEALRRSETIYLPGKNITMLPEELTRRLSLRADEDRRAIGLFFEITPQMVILGFDVKKCVINVNKNYSYDEVDELLLGDSTIGTSGLLKDMYSISTGMHDLSKYGTNYRKLKKIKKNLLEQTPAPLEETINPSLNMIAQFMIIANTVIANYFSKQDNLPFIYRINLAGYSGKVVEKVKEISRANISFDELRTYINYILPPSVYSVVNFGHNALRLDAYCHFTNPLRNYPSLENQRLVEEYMINDGQGHKKKYDETYYSELCNYINERISLDNDYVEEAKQLYKRYDEVDKN